ncbi:hypothetical protein QBC32DRAFT_390357, partial [Pseudoneurospora amorphoporcata]
FPHPNRQREKDHTSSHQESSVVRVGPESTITSGNQTIVSLFQLSQGINILKEQQYCSVNMSNENHVPQVPRITPIYSTLSYADILKKGLSANHNPEMTTENDEPRSQPGQTTTMPTENGNPPAVSYTAAAKTGLPPSNTSNQNRRPRSSGDSSTTSPTNNADTTLATLGSPHSPSQPTVEAHSGNSTDSSDQPLAASRRRRRRRSSSSTQTREPLLPNNQAKPSKSAQASQAGQSSSRAPRPTPKPKSNGLFLRSVVASCGCLYVAECKSEMWRPSRHSLRRAGFPLKGRCSRCQVLVTEIRLNEKIAEAEVTEIVLPAGKGEEEEEEEEEEQQDGQQHVGVEDVAEIYIDDVEHVDEDEDGYVSDYGETSEASQL